MSRRTAAAAIPGPSATELLLGSLGACTSITLRMYAGRKDWELGKITVGLRYSPAADGGKAHIERRLSFAKPLTDEQSQRLLEIAGKTPVTLALTAGMTIDTSIAQHPMPASTDPPKPLEPRAHALELLGRVDPRGRRLMQGDQMDAHAVLERAQLLQFLGDLERRRRPAGKLAAGSSPDRHRCRCAAKRDAKSPGRPPGAASRGQGTRARLK